MLMTNKDIMEELEKGHNSCVVIDPFRPDQLNNASYDVTLGEHFWRYDIHDRWILEKDFIYLKPNERALGHTQEFIGGRVAPDGRAMSVNTKIYATSTAGRHGITVCDDAGWGDIGYFSRYTLELQNKSSVPVTLRTGHIIAQVVFYSCGLPLPDTSYEAKGQYQKSNILEDLKEKWEPHMMLPKPLKRR